MSRRAAVVPVGRTVQNGLMLMWLNGQLLDDEPPALSIGDSGLLHAAGVFTTLRADAAVPTGGVPQPRVLRLAAHLRRLRASAEALALPLPYSDGQLTDAVAQLLSAAGLTNARLRLTLTRGRITQDPLHGAHAHPTCLLTAAPLTPYPEEFYRRGMTVILLDEQKLNPYDIQAGHKTLNYFSRLQALRWARDRRAAEALWFDVHNYLQSASLGNVFIVNDDRLLTPPTPADLRDADVAAATPYPRSCVLDGITRAAVLEVAAARGLTVRIGAINVRQLLDAREVFITNSIMRVMPVCRLEGKAVGEDRPGEVTRMLMQALAELAAQEAADDARGG